MKDFHSFFSHLEFKKSIFNFKTFSIVKKIALTSLLACIGIVLKFIEIPTFSSFLKLDFALIPVLLLLFFATYPYVISCVFIIDLISLRGSIYGWLASLFFSLTLINGIYVFKSLFALKFKNRLFCFNFAFLLSILITTLFMFVVNTYFITPAFFGMTYSQLQSSKIWSNFSSLFFTIPSYKLAMLLFYSTFNMLLKGPVLIILFNLIAIPLFYLKIYNKSKINKRSRVKL